MQLMGRENILAKRRDAGVTSANSIKFAVVGQWTFTARKFNSISLGTSAVVHCWVMVFRAGV